MFLFTSSQSLVYGSLTIPEILLGVCGGKTIFIIILRHYLPFHWVNIYTDDAKAMVSKTVHGQYESRQLRLKNFLKSILYKNVFAE